MRRSPVPSVDLAVYAKAVPLLVRNPSIVVVPLLTVVIGVLLDLMLAPSRGDGLSTLTAQLMSFVKFLLVLFGLGAACIMADDAWRHGRASFDNGWTEARARAPEILFASVGIGLLLSVARYAGMLIGPLALVLVVAAVVFLIWTIPAAAVGGNPGGAAIQVSIDRVRGAAPAAVVAAVVTILLVFLVILEAPLYLDVWLPAYAAASSILKSLVDALLEAIAVGYIALILTKTYTDAAFTRRW